MARHPFSESKIQQRRSDILETAMTRFERDGLEGVSLRKVAAAMGCSYTALYRYFPSKESLITAMRVQAYRWIEADMLSAIEGIDDPEAQLETLARAYILAGIRQPDRYALMFFKIDGAGNVRSSLELRSAKHDALDVCTRAIAAAQASGQLPDTIDPLTASHLFWTAAHGLVSLEVAGQFEMGRSVNAMIPTLIHTLRMGMAHFSERTDLSALSIEKEAGHG